MNNQVEEIKQKVDIVELVGESVALKKAGRHYKGLCPFHSEKSPSFIVSPERQSFKCFGCFPPGALIATPTQLRPIENIRQGDIVIGGSGKSRRVTRLLEREYEGEMLDVYLAKLGGFVTLTKDHKVKVVRGAPYTRKYKDFSKRYRKYLKLEKDRFQEKIEKYFPIEELSAGELEKGDLLLYPINREVECVNSIDLSKYITRKLPLHGTKPRNIDYLVSVNKQLLQLIGYYLAEGSSHRAYLRFSLGNHEMDFAKDIQRLIKRIFGLEVGIHVRSGSHTGIEVTCCHSLLADAFRNMCGDGAENKHIPYELMGIEPTKQMMLVMAMVRGDGTCFMGNKSNNTLREFISLTSISREMIFQTRNILLRSGFFPTEHFQNEKVDKNNVNHRKAFTIQWIKDGFSKYYLTYRDNSVDYWLLPIKKILRNTYEGKVYNITVEKDHSYLPVNFVVGNCGEGGDAISFLEKYDGMSFLEALETLAQRVGIKLESYRPSAQDVGKKRLLEVMSLSGEYYQYLLTKHEVGAEAREYLKKRGILGETIKLYGLGYAPNQWQGVSTFLKKKGYKDEELEQVGMVIRSESGRYYDRFRGRVMFPLRDHKGSVVGFSGRILEGKDPTSPTATQGHGAKYINSPETMIYHKSQMLYGLWENKQEIRKKDQLVIVEGELDVLPSYQAGVKNVVAIKGSAFTSEMGRLIMRYTRNVVYALDADKAGQEAVKRAVVIAEPQDLLIRVVQIIGGKDPGDVATADPKAWREMVKGATLYWDYLIEMVIAKHELRSGQGMDEITREVVPALNLISNVVVRAHYAQLLAKKLGVAEEVIHEEMQRLSKKQQLSSLKQVVKKIEKGETKGRREQVEEYFLALSLQYFDKIKTKLIELKPIWFETVVIQKVIANLQSHKGEWKIQDWAKTQPAELISIIDETYLQDLSGIDNFEKEWEKVAREVEELYLKERLKTLSVEIVKKENSERGEGLEELQREFRETSKQLSQLS